MASAPDHDKRAIGGSGMGRKSRSRLLPTRAEGEAVAVVSGGSGRHIRRSIHPAPVFSGSPPIGIDVLAIRNFGCFTGGWADIGFARYGIRQQDQHKPYPKGRQMNVHRKTLWLGCGLALIAALIFIGSIWPFQSLTKMAYMAAFLRGGLIVVALSLAFGLGLKLSYFARASLGLWGVAMTMTIQSLLIEHTPYEIWSTILSTSGALGFLLSLGGAGLWNRIARLAGDE